MCAGKLWNLGGDDDDDDVWDLFCRREALPLRLHRLWSQILSLRPVKEAPAQTHRYTGVIYMYKYKETSKY